MKKLVLLVLLILSFLFANSQTYIVGPAAFKNMGLTSVPGAVLTIVNSLTGQAMFKAPLSVGGINYTPVGVNITVSGNTLTGFDGTKYLPLVSGSSYPLSNNLYFTNGAGIINASANSSVFLNNLSASFNSTGSVAGIFLTLDAANSNYSQAVVNSQTGNYSFLKQTENNISVAGTNTASFTGIQMGNYIRKTNSLITLSDLNAAISTITGTVSTITGSGVVVVTSITNGYNISVGGVNGYLPLSAGSSYPLTGDLYISSPGNTASIYGGNTTYPSVALLDDGTVQLASNNNTISGSVVIGPGASASYFQISLSDNLGNAYGITFDKNSDNSININGLPGFKGIVYNADYKSNYTTRSLVDKAYVDGKVSDVIVTATNANYTITSSIQLVKLPLITAARTLTLPVASAHTGLKIKIWNQNTSGTFSWSFTTTVKDATNTNITTMVNSSWYILESDGTSWLKIN